MIRLLRLYSLLIAMAFPVASAARAQAPSRPGDPVTGVAAPLFNGKNLDGWISYIEPGSGDAAAAWKIEDGTLRASGVGRGYLRTSTAYADYKLHVEWRWPREGGNSGVMVHVVGADQLWPKCFECQLRHTSAGDFASFIDARSKEELVARNPGGFSTGRLVRPGPPAEKPLGEWNSYDVTAEGDSLSVAVNGKPLNRMTRVIPSAGMIALQTEGSAIDFRNITITLLPPAKDLHAPLPTATK